MSSAQGLHPGDSAGRPRASTGVSRSRPSRDEALGSTVCSLRRVTVRDDQGETAGKNSRTDEEPLIGGQGLSRSLQHLSISKKSSYRSAMGNYRVLREGEMTSVMKSSSSTPHVRQSSTGPHSHEPRIRSTIDWTESAQLGDHLWIPTSISGDYCYLADFPDCFRSGSRYQCSVCKIVSHIGCIPCLERNRQSMAHHWVYRRRENSKCVVCGRSFPQRFSFQSKENVAISCSWCKETYHIGCFNLALTGQQCVLGIHARIIVPPHWIIKLARKGSFKSNTFKKKRRISLKKRDSREEHSRPFVIKPVPTPDAKPLLVFINPKSGGNQGAQIMHKFQGLLNPRQIFDLSKTGPHMALELYKKVPNLRVLACGGDGTVGWILSHIDSLGITPHPPVAILPLGTGNDLARTLNWGGGYTDEPLSKVLSAVEEGSVVYLDRWNLTVSRSPEIETSMVSMEEGGGGSGGLTGLPLDVMNNYFSLGADAHVSLEFHESREANPERFSSRFWNKMFYAGAGGKDLLKRTWKDLSEHIMLQCDDQDLTEKIRETKCHCLLFLNIPKYAAGTTPWGNPSGSNSVFEPQRHDDGFLEVIGFTAASLAGLQIGAHSGIRLTQCQRVRLTTLKTIPMQVDGEPCRLLPSVIEISLRNHAHMVLKPVKRGNTAVGACLYDVGSGDTVICHEPVAVQVSWVTGSDYRNLRQDKPSLQHTAIRLGPIYVDGTSDLESARVTINVLREKVAGVGAGYLGGSVSGSALSGLSNNWRYLDAATADRFFQIDLGQERLYYVSDITASDNLYILDLDTIPLSPTILGNVTSTSSIENGSTPPASPLFDGDEGVSAARVIQQGETPSLRDDLDACDTGEEVEGVGGGDIRLKRLGGRKGSGAGSRALSRRAVMVMMPSSPSNGESSSSIERTPLKLMRSMAVKSRDRLPLSTQQFFEACKTNNLDKLKNAVANGAGFLLIDKCGLTGLHLAVRYGGHKDIVRYLLDHAPSDLLEVVDKDKNQTALHMAAWLQERTICDMLLKAGALTNVTDNQGNTPADLARAANDLELAIYLAASANNANCSNDSQNLSKITRLATETEI